MLNYIEYLNLPTIAAMSIVAVLLVLNCIGEVLEFKGKIVPEWVKMRKYFDRKKREREVLEKMPELFDAFQETCTTFKDAKTLIENVGKHYNDDNIAMRNEWIKGVNHKFDENDKLFKELSAKLDKNNEDTLSILIDNKRNAIIDFASYVIDEGSPVTREQFHRTFKLYDEYEQIIARNNMTNGEVDIAIQIIREAYEKHMRCHNFIEDLRGYGK